MLVLNSIRSSRRYYQKHQHTIRSGLNHGFLKCSSCHWAALTSHENRGSYGTVHPPIKNRFDNGLTRAYHAACSSGPEIYYLTLGETASASAKSDQYVRCKSTNKALSNVDPRIQEWLGDIDTAREIIQRECNRNLSVVQCTISQDAKAPSEKFTASLTQEKADAYNKKCYETYIAMIFLFDTFIAAGRLTTGDERLTDDEKDLNAMLFSEMTFQGGRRYQYIKKESTMYRTNYPNFQRDSDNLLVDIGLVAKYIHLLLTKFDGDGEALLNAVSITRHDLTGSEAFLQQLEKSHTHHHFLGRDQNPQNFELENHYHNQGRKLCSLYFFNECMCRTKCHPRLHLITKENFEELVKLEIYKGPFGLVPNASEKDIRQHLATKILEHIDRFRQQVDDLGLNFEFLHVEAANPGTDYGHISAMIPPVTVGDARGVLCPDQKCHFTFSNMFRTDGNVQTEALPLGWMERMINSIKTLEPVEFTMLDDDGPRKHFEISREVAVANNRNIVKYMQAFPEVIKLLTKGKLSSSHPDDLPRSYVDAKSLVFTNRSKNGDVQLLQFNIDGPMSHRPIAYRVVPMLQSFIDDYQGDVDIFARAFSIKGSGITPAQACAQTFQASHKNHFPVDCNPDNIELENRGDNHGRKICNFYPTLPCGCRTPCMVLPVDLSEGAFAQDFRSEYLQIPFGRFPGVSSNPDLRSRLLNDYEAIHRQLGQDPPSWIMHHSRRTDDTVQALFEYQGLPNYTGVPEHKNGCGIAKADVGEAVDTPPVDIRKPIISARNLSGSMKDEMEDLIHKYGWGDWVLIRSLLTTFTTSRPLTILVNARAKYNYLKDYPGWVYGYPRHKNYPHSRDSK